MWLSDMFTSRKQKLFFELLTQQCDLLLRAARALAAYCATGEKATANEIEQIEGKGDEVLRQVIAALTDTFVTPYDRQDIYNLAGTIDDMIDYLNSAVSEMMLFRVEPTPAVREMAQILVEAAGEIGAAVAAMQHDDSDAAVEHALKASRAENDVEALYRTTIAELFDGDDFHRIFKLREIYRHLSNSADRADAIGKLIGKIVVKVA